MGTVEPGKRVMYIIGGSIPDFYGQFGYVTGWYQGTEGPHVHVKWDNPRIFDGVYAFHVRNLKVVMEEPSWEM